MGPAKCDKRHQFSARIAYQMVSECNILQVYLGSALRGSQDLASVAARFKKYMLASCSNPKDPFFPIRKGFPDIPILGMGLEPEKSYSIGSCPRILRETLSSKFKLRSPPTKTPRRLIHSLFNAVGLFLFLLQGR